MIKCFSEELTFFLGKICVPYVELTDFLVIRYTVLLEIGLGIKLIKIVFTDVARHHITFVSVCMGNQRGPFDES